MVVVSIFVNPLQFGPGEDYARYPRPLEDDLRVCEADGVDIVFVPSVSDLYPAGRQVSVDAGTLGSVLEGHSRPGHFNGVLTVVLKLFNIIRPQVAIFGEKDAQQLACIQRMVTDLNIAIEIVGAPIVREPDGLALSSRNVFLTASERAVARSLSAALEKAATQSSVPRPERPRTRSWIGPRQSRPSNWTTPPSSIRPRSLRCRMIMWGLRPSLSRLASAEPA